MGKRPHVKIKNPPKPAWPCHYGEPCTCDKYPEHNTNSDECWCEPEIITMENGNKVIVHKEET